MTRRLLFFFSLIAFATPQFISQIAQQQPQGFGTIRGTIVREGTTEPIPDVPVSITGRGGMTAQEAQALLTAVGRGGALGANVPAEVLQNAQEAARGGQALSAVSDRDGQFTIANVPAGQQTVRAQLEGYFMPMANGTYPPSVPQQVNVTAGQTTNLRISMVAGGTITGRVLDPAGKPISEATVQVLQQGYENGVLRLQLADLKQTDDRGEYRLYRLAPGEYYVAASPRPALLGLRGSPPTNSQEAQVSTFYPGVTEPSSATRISLRPGDDLGGINIQLRTTTVGKVSGRVTTTAPVGPIVGQGPRGQARNAGIVLVSTSTTGLMSMDAANSVTLNPDGGTFEFQNVAPGTYDLIARLPAMRGGGWGPQAPPDVATGPWVFGRTSIDTRSGNAENIAIVVRPGVDVKGRLLLDGKPIRANARITLLPENANPQIGDQQTSLVFNQIRQYAAPIADDGAFTIPQIPEGRYRFQVVLNAPAAAARGAAQQAAATTQAPPAPALPTGTYVADIRQGATSVYDNGLVVGGGNEVNPVEVLLGTSAGSLEGDVLGSDQKPVAAMTIVLVPPDNRRQNAALYKTGRSNEQGHFTLPNVPPGRYTLYAWESVPAGAYQNAQFMERYAARGISVNIQAGTRTTANVSVIRE